ncbi:hypothetical protein ZWY2020_031252 [Hordeum vulgare]|nr:hypothetical protein ZWY2020_031252 [Hordeum vulgare]
MVVDKPGGSGGGGASSSPASTTDRTTSSRSCSAGTTSASSPPPTYTRIPPHQLTVPDGIPEPSPSPGWGGQGADKAKGLPEVKNSYASVDEYLGVFEPLLFGGGGGGGGWLDGQRGAVRSCAESEGFHKLSMLVSDGLRDIVSLSENDLLLLSKEKFEEGVNPTAYAFAVVEQRGGKDTLSLRTFVAGEIQNLNVAQPVKSLRLHRFASILSIALCGF